MPRYRVHFVIDVPLLFAVDVEANSREEAEAIARENPWEPGDKVIRTEWTNDPDHLEFDWESDRPLELVPERGDNGIEELPHE